MVGMTELWSFLSPWNIWDLRYGDWCGFAGTYDRRLEEAKNQPT